MSLRPASPSEILGGAWRHCRLCGAEIPTHGPYLLGCVACADAERQRAKREAFDLRDALAAPRVDFDETHHHPHIDAPCGLERRTP